MVILLTFTTDDLYHFSTCCIVAQHIHLVSSMLAVSLRLATAPSHWLGCSPKDPQTYTTQRKMNSEVDHKMASFPAFQMLLGMGGGGGGGGRGGWR